MFSAVSVELPSVFRERMLRLLGADEYEDFLQSLNRKRSYGLRVNTAKISCEELEGIVPFPLRKLPFVDDGYAYEEDVHPARCPLYQAGLYYLQDPGAMLPASRLPLRPGMRVLDMCAAPGGKATAAGALLKGEGFLAANDFSPSRARALLRNLELFGITNAFVSSEAPADLVSRFTGYFDAILLDAPCSGEGMFRKDVSLLRDWSEEKSLALLPIQRELLESAVEMLRPGGYLMYSTCTFAPEENEGAVACILAKHPELSLCRIENTGEFSGGNVDLLRDKDKLGSEVKDAIRRRCVRIYPHKAEAEGQFMALLQKETGAGAYAAFAEEKKRKKRKTEYATGISKEERGLLEKFFLELGIRSIGGRSIQEECLAVYGERVYLLPEVEIAEGLSLKGVSFLRNGLYLGDLKKGRFEPSHPLALALHKGEAAEPDAVISLSAGDERLFRYLEGEPVQVGEESRKNGWKLLCVEGYPLAFGKQVGDILKNKVPAGWRSQRQS